MSKRHLYLLVLCLTIVGLGIFLYKFLVLGFPLSFHAISDTWNVECRITFGARNAPVKVSLFIPRNTKYFAIENENFISRGYGIATATEQGNRQAVWSIRQAKGQQTLYYRAVVRRVDTKEPSAVVSPPEIKEVRLSEPQLSAAESLISEIRAKSADVDTMVKELIKRLNMPHPDENVALLLDKQAAMSHKVKLATRVLARAGIPARAIHGVRLEQEDRDAHLIHWLEVYEKRQWRSYDLVRGESGVPPDYFPWWQGIRPLAQIDGGDNLQVSLSVTLSQEEAVRAAIQSGKIKSPLLLEFSLFSLPIHTQAVYRVLLLVPVGAFLLVILRNVIGIKTFGTFMPVLIALAFRETQLLWGIILFSLVVGLGLSVRRYLEHLKLLLVPRLASVLLVVVLIMALLSVLTHKLGLERGLSVALFPMVILTMTIERMSIVWEERGASEALQQAAGSLMVAALAYLIMSISYVEHLVFVFPELLLVLLAVTLLLGRYYGYRLVELRRFKALVRREV
ncbi:MAG: UUP1 family membrane protein [Deltaproteobacteria bacterium]|nr:MAG: UUP1 family membrane protein [Deltaproteobacteria bacterium]